MPWLIPLGEMAVEGGAAVLEGGALTGEAVEGTEVAGETYEALRAKQLADAARQALAAKRLLDAIREGSQTDVCTTCDPPNDPCKHLKTGSGSGKYRGGAHEGTSKPANDGLDSHHMPASDAIKGTLGRDDGPAIQMEPADHQLTASWGRSRSAMAYRARQADLIRQGKLSEAFANDVEDVRKIAAAKGDPHRYDEAFKEALAYADCLAKNKIVPGAGPD